MRQTVDIVREDETLEDLQCGGLMLIQKRSGFRFGVDAVLLADFAKDAKSQRTLDLCTGTGIVAVLLSSKTATPEIRALEIQHEIYDMARRSVVYNHLEDRVHVDEGDLKDAARLYGNGTFDKITVNPPYMECGSALLNEADTKTVSRHEVLCTLKDVIASSAALLRPQGRFFMVHRPSRLADILCLMREYRIEPKRLRMVHPYVHKAANLILIEGMKHGGKELKLLPPLYIYNEDGSYSGEINRIYGR